MDDQPAVNFAGTGDGMDRPGGAPVIEARDLQVTFRIKRGGFRRPVHLHAVRDVDLVIGAGETLGLVGESGSGKSTTGRALLRLVDVAGGQVLVDGRDITHLRAKQLRPLREQMQMVFQDPYSSLDPSAVVADIVGEPLRVHRGLKGRRRDERVRDLLEHVGLDARHLERYPYEFSGGQRQRIAIARAIALNPHLIVLDEAVSALDVSTQNQILELLEQLRRELGLAYLFISHDLSVVRWIADRTAVMYLGHLVESGPTDRIYADPQHPYTESLLSAVPVPDPVVQAERKRIILHGDLPDPISPPSGCPFRTRCQHAMDVCAQTMPERVDIPAGGWVACHLHNTGGPPSPRSSTAQPTSTGG